MVHDTVENHPDEEMERRPTRELVVGQVETDWQLEDDRRSTAVELKLCRSAQESTDFLNRL